MRHTSILLALLLIAAPVLGGSQSDPELTDPAGDQSETAPGIGDTSGVPGGADHDFSDTDIVAAWFEEPDNATFTVAVETEVALQSNTVLTVSFNVDAGPTSMYASTASGATIDIESTGTTVNSGPATMVQSSNLAIYTITRADVGAVGGDVLSGLTVSASRSEAAGCAAICAAQTGSDSAPGPARDFTLSRPDLVAGASLVIGRASVTETMSNATTNQTEVATRTVTLGPGQGIETYDVNATIVYNLTLTNSGTDQDTYNLSLLATAFLATKNVNATMNLSQATLAPGANITFNATITLANAEYGDHGLIVGINSTNGVDTLVASLLRVLQPIVAPEPAPEPEPEPATNTTVTATGRDPMVGKGTFLQDAAEAMNFDKLFGDYAELVLLALAVLVIVLLIFLVLLLVGFRWVKVTVTPKRATIAPGETAEFHVQVRNRKRRFHDAMAYFEGAASWKTGVLLRNEEGEVPRPLTSTQDESALGLSPRKEMGDAFAGTLRVQAPFDAGDGERDDITLNVVPLDAEGHRRMTKAGTAKVHVRTATVDPDVKSGALMIRMSRVEHVPSDPEPGEEVHTTATIENDGARPVRLRVVMQLDGSDHAEDTVEVPPTGARAITFPWRAGSGANRVRVQIFKA